MESVYSPFPALSEKERLLLKGISNRDPKEREKVIQKYKEWIEEELLNNKNNNLKHIGDSVLHALQVSFGGQMENEMIGFVELVDAILDFPIIVADRLVFITSLLEEIIEGNITETMISPVICTSKHLFEIYYMSIIPFLQKIMDLSYNRLAQSSSSVDIILSIRLLSCIFEACPCVVPNSIVAKLPSIIIPLLYDGKQNYHASISTLLYSLVLSLKRLSKMDCLAEFSNGILTLFQPFTKLLPNVSLDSIIQNVQSKKHTTSQGIPEILYSYIDEPSVVLKKENYIVARSFLECILLFCKNCYECIEGISDSVVTMSIQCLVFVDSSINQLVIGRLDSYYLALDILSCLMEHMDKQQSSFIEDAIIPIFMALFSSLPTRFPALVSFAAVTCYSQDITQYYSSSLLYLIHESLTPSLRNEYGKYGVLALTLLLQPKEVYEQFLLNELENILQLPLDTTIVDCLLKGILLFPYLEELKDGLYFKFRYCFSPSFFYKNDHLRLTITEDEFSDMTLRNEEDVMNCLFLMLSLPISYSGYLPQLMDLVIECINHQSNRVYYKFELSERQVERLYSNLFSLITVTFNDVVLVLVAYLISLLPHYQYVINENWSYFVMFLSSGNTMIIQQLTPLLSKLSAVVPNLVFLFLQSTVYQALENYKNSVKLEDSISNLLLIATCYQDCSQVMESYSHNVFHTLVASLKQTTSLIHRLTLFHTLAQICQGKNEFISDNIEELLMILSEVVDQIDVMAKNKHMQSMSEASTQTRESYIFSTTKNGMFLESGVVLTFLQSLLQADCYSLLISKYPNIIRYVLFFSTFDYPQLPVDSQQTDLELIDSNSLYAVDALIHNSSLPSINAVFNTITTFYQNLLHCRAVSRGYFVYSKNKIHARWYISLSQRYQLSVYNLDILNKLAIDLLNEIAILRNNTLKNNDFFVVINELRKNYLHYIGEIRELKQVVLRKVGLDLSDINTLINKQLCQCCFQAFLENKVVNDQTLLFKEFQILVLRFPVMEHPFVASFVEALASGLSKKQFHPNLVSSIFPFFTAVIDHFSPYLNTSIQYLLPSSIQYWKSNLDELLQFVNNCSTLSSFANHYGIVVEQLVYILYDNNYCVIDERISVLIHLTMNIRSLQKYLHLVLPAIQYTIEDRPNHITIQLLGMNLFKDIVFHLDISRYYEFISSILGSLSMTRNVTLIRDIVDIVCMIASKYSNLEPHTVNTTIVIKNRYFVNSYEDVTESTPAETTFNIHMEDQVLVGADEPLYILLPSFNQEVYPANSLTNEKEKGLLSRSDRTKRMHEYAIPFLFHELQNMETSHSHMHRFITSLLDQYSLLLHKYHYYHTNLALVKKAISESNGIIIKYDNNFEQNVRVINILKNMEIHSLSFTLQSPKTDLPIAIITDIKDITITSTLQLLMQMVKQLPLQTDEWNQWICRFQSLFVQCVCSSHYHILLLFKQYIPSLEESLFLSSFVFFWFSLTSLQRVMLHNSFLSITPVSIPYSIAIVFISMQMAIIDLDSKSTLFFKEKEFPFPFDFIIHLCSLLHFDDSGLRLATMVFHNSDSDVLDIHGMMKDCINMGNRSLLTGFPAVSSYHFIQEFSHTTDSGVSFVNNVVETCILKMSDWKDIYTFFSDQQKTALSTQEQLFAKRGMVKSLFQMGQLSDILHLCKDESDEELQEYSICARFGLNQFKTVCETLQRQQRSFKCELKQNTLLELRKTYYLSLSTVLVFLSNNEKSKANQFIKYVQSIYYQNYKDQLKSNKSDFLPTQVYLFVINELLSLITNGSIISNAYTSFSRLNKIIQQNKNDSSIWSDVYVFRKFIHYLYPSVNLSDHLISISSNLQITPFIKELKSSICQSQIHMVSKEYAYAFAKLLYNNQHVEDAIAITQHLKATLLMDVDESGSVVDEMEAKEYIIRCSNRLLKWDPPPLSVENFHQHYNEVLKLPQLSINYKIYRTLASMYSQLLNSSSSLSTHSVIESFMGVVTNALMLIPSKLSIANLDLLHQFVILVNHLDHSFSSSVNNAFMQIPISSFQMIFTTLVEYAMVAEIKWGLHSFQYKIYKKYLILFSVNEILLTPLIIQLQNRSSTLAEELQHEIMETKPRLLHSVLQLVRELKQLPDTKLARFRRLFDIYTSMEFDHFSQEYALIRAIPNQCAIDFFVHDQLPETITPAVIESICTKLEFISKREGSLLINYSAFLSSISPGSRIHLNLMDTSSFLNGFEKYIRLEKSMFDGEITMVFTEKLSNQTELTLQLSTLPYVHFSYQVIRLSALLSSLFYSTPLNVQNMILPLSDSLGLFPYHPYQSLSSILQESRHDLPDKYKEKGFQYFLWKHCNSSEDWSNQMAAFSVSLQQRAFETTFLSMGVLNSSHLLIDRSTFKALFIDYSRAFSSLNKCCQIQLEKGINSLFYDVHKSVYLTTIDSNLSMIKNMVQCEIVENSVDSVSSIVLDSLCHRADEIRCKDWTGVLYL